MWVILKSFFLTLLFFLIMQTQWGSATLEHHTMTWVRTSSLFQPLRSFSHTVVKGIDRIWSHAIEDLQSWSKKALEHSERRFPSSHDYARDIGARLSRSSDILVEGVTEATRDLGQEWSHRKAAPTHSKQVSSDSSNH